MSYGVLITARLKSKRFKKKILKKLINNQTIIEYLINNLFQQFPKNKIVLITSKSNQDKILTTIAKKFGVNYYTGEPLDVLSRMYKASKKFGFKNIISCTADNPLIDTDYAKKILNYHINNKNDLTTLLDLPIGLFTYAIKVKALKTIINKKASKNTETWVEYFHKINSLKIEKYCDKKFQKINKNIRLTVDYKEDLEMVNKVLSLSKKNYPRLMDIIKIYKKKPEIIKINSHKVQKSVIKPRLKKLSNT